MKLLVQSPGVTSKPVYPVVHAITTVGSSKENDVTILDPGVEEFHAQIIHQGGDCKLQCASRRAKVEINGSWVKAALLKHGDEIRIGNCLLVFSTEAEIPSEGTGENLTQTRAIAGYRELVDFSAELMQCAVVEDLLQALLDRLVQLTDATKGFVVLTDQEGQFRHEVARNILKGEGDTLTSHLSDSIVQKALETGEALIVRDALHDTEFSSSASVVNLRLCSVMCAPLIARGETLGVIYLGNDSIANLFHESSLSLVKPFVAQASLIIRNAQLLDELKTDNEQLRETLESFKFGNIIGSCPSMMDIFRKVEKIATTDISVLIEGETGTGKELIALELHARSNRSKGPFIVINCGAIPENLLESELFGHIRGAFTGAVATKIGKFQAANGGTLFLDELGEMPLQLQVKLLRALQDRQVTKVGDSRQEKVDIRVVAATNKTLSKEVKEGRFREDLYYRLNVVALNLPPLRERGGDIEVIARYFLQRYAAEFSSKATDFSKECVAAMRKHEWSGNIREMENRVKKAVVFAESKKVTVNDMDLEDGIVHKILPLAEAKEDFQMRYIDKVLRMNDGNRTKTARDLGVDPRTIFRHLEKAKEERPRRTLGSLLDRSD